MHLVFDSLKERVKGLDQRQIEHIVANAIIVDFSHNSKVQAIAWVAFGGVSLPKAKDIVESHFNDKENVFRLTARLERAA